jgi:hypothetical protein
MLFSVFLGILGRRVVARRSVKRKNVREKRRSTAFSRALVKEIVDIF